MDSHKVQFSLFRSVLTPKRLPSLKPTVVEHFQMRRELASGRLFIHEAFSEKFWSAWLGNQRITHCGALDSHKAIISSFSVRFWFRGRCRHSSLQRSSTSACVIRSSPLAAFSLTKIFKQLLLLPYRSLSAPSEMTRYFLGICPLTSSAVYLRRSCR